MKNRRLTREDRNNIKGGIRRAFSRSELRKKILDNAILKDFQDPSRKRVTRWGYCADCGALVPAYLLEVDHKEPVQPLGVTLEEMSTDDLVDRVWCDERKLQALCENCHKAKSKSENAERRRIKKENKK